VLLYEVSKNERREEGTKKEKRKRKEEKITKNPENAKRFALVAFSHSKRTPFFDIRGSRCW